MAYQIVVQQLIKSFTGTQFEHVPRAYNKHTDTLATLASKIDIPDETVDMRIMKKTSLATMDFNQ